MHIYNGIEIDINAWPAIGGAQYGPDWLADPAARAELGIIEIDGAPPAVGANQRAVRGEIEQDGEGAWSLRWAVVDLTADEIAARDATAVAEVAGLKVRLAAETDTRIAAIYDRWTRFDQEYVAREAAARAFVAANYEGECSAWVTSFAEPAGLTSRAAADRIIVQADALRGALEQLGALRMRKYEITRATTAPVAQAAYDSIISNAAAIEAVL